MPFGNNIGPFGALSQDRRVLEEFKGTHLFVRFTDMVVSHGLAAI